MSMSRISILVLGILAVALGGCGRQPYVTGARLDRGLVLVYTGIEGRSPFNHMICQGLVRGGVPYAVELTDWTVGVPGAYLVNLRSEKRNRTKAAEIAERILMYQQQYPGRPVVLVGQSGGAAMALWTAEAMGDDAGVEAIVLVAASLSPQYPLTEAMDHSRKGVVSFYSSSDMLFLGMGTTMYGTMDGKHSSSAGRLGFRVGDNAENPQWAGRFYQIPWRRSMSEVGHWGGHTSTSARGFIRDYVAPLVKAEHWDGPFIEGVAAGEAQQTIRSESPAVGYHRF